MRDRLGRATKRVLRWIGQAAPSGALRVRALRTAGMSYSGREIRHGCRMDDPAHVSIGENSFVNFDVTFHTSTEGRVIIGKNCDIAPNVLFTCSTHEIGESERRAGRCYQGSIVVGDGVWIGAGAIVLPGVTIGHGSIIGAAALVNKDVPPNCIWGGVPGKLIRRLDD